MSMTIAPLGPAVLSPVQTVTQPVPATGPSEMPFARVIDQMLGEVNQQQVQADQAVKQLALGQTNDLHNVLLSVAKADLSFRLVLEIRNRLTDAYQAVMQMQV